jgi:hypothetical protein
MSSTSKTAAEHAECERQIALARGVHCVMQHAARSDAGEGSMVDRIVGDLAKRDIHYSRTTLYQFSNPYQPDEAVRVPLCVVDAATAATGNKVLWRPLARRSGDVYVEIPRIANGDGGVLETLARLSKEFSDVPAAMRDAMQDGHVSESDLAEFEIQADELIAAVVASKAFMRARHERDARTAIAGPRLAAQR